jgi:hypothetical protein
MSETVDYRPGRSLLAEMTELREEMTNIRAALLRLVELQQEANQKLDAALSVHPITGEAATPAQVV